MSRTVRYDGLVEGLRAQRARFVALLADLDDAQWDAPTECTAWRVKGIALHVLGDDLSLLSRQRDTSGNGLVLYAETHPGLDFRALLDGFNEQWVEAATFVSPPLVVHLLILTGDWTADFYAAVAADAPGEQVGFFAATGPSPYWQIVAREFVERWIHEHQIRRALAAVDPAPVDGDEGDDHLALAAEIIVHQVSAHLGDLAAPTGVTIDVEVPGVGAWSLVRQPESWSVVPAVEPATATVRLDAAVAGPLLSRGLRRSAVERAFSTAGDPDLAAAVVERFARLTSQG